MSGVSEKAVEEEIFSKRDTNWIAGSVVVSFVCGAALVGLFWFGFSVFSFFRVPSEVLQRAANFGDAFGVVNAVISAAACAALVITLRMQIQQMKGQEEDQRKAEADRKASSEIMLLTAYLQCVTAEWTASGTESEDSAVSVKRAFRRYMAGKRMGAILTTFDEKLQANFTDAEADRSEVIQSLVDIVAKNAEFLRLHASGAVRDLVAHTQQNTRMCVMKVASLEMDANAAGFGDANTALLGEAKSLFEQAVKASQSDSGNYRNLVRMGTDRLSQFIKTVCESL